MSDTISDAVARLATPRRSVAPAPKVARDALGRLLPGQRLNPGGMNKEQREFLARLKNEDADAVYAALMDLVAQRNVTAVLRCVEYIAGKPREVIDVAVTQGARELDLGRLSAEQLQDLRKLIGRAADGQGEGGESAAAPQD